MPDKSINIVVKTNIEKINEQQNILNKQFAQQIKLQQSVTGMSKSQLGYLYSQQNAWNKIKITSDLTADEISQIDKNLALAGKDIKGIESPFETLLKSVSPFGGMLIKQKNRVEELALAFGRVGKSGGFFNVMGDYLTNFTGSLMKVQKGMSMTFGSGMKGIISNLGTGFKALLPALSGLIGALAPMLPVIALIVAAVFTLSRIWKNNVGGLQTHWHRFMGALKDTWARFVVTFDKLLRALSPVFKIIFGAIFIPMVALLKVIQGIFSIIGAILDPIISAISEITGAFADAFGISTTGSMDLFKALKPITDILIFLGKVLGFLISTALKPIIFFWKLVALGVKTVVEWLKPLGEFIKKAFDNPAIKGFITALKFILDGIKAIVDFFNKGEKAVKSMGEAEKRNMSDIRTLQAQPVTTSQVYNTRNSTINNNSNVVVQSSGAITKENAPHIANVISSNLVTSNRVMSA